MSDSLSPRDRQTTAAAPFARDDALDRWEGETQIAIGGFIRSYLADHPPPGPTVHPALYEDWARQLLEAGEARLAVGRAMRLSAG